VVMYIYLSMCGKNNLSVNFYEKKVWIVMLRNDSD
jgi:hypothetical protein